MIVKMMQDLGKRMEAQIEKMQEIFNKDLEELKNKLTEMNNIVTEMKNTLEGINSRVTEAQEWINELKDRIVEVTAMEQNKEKRMKRNEDSLKGVPNPWATDQYQSMACLEPGCKTGGEQQASE